MNYLHPKTTKSVSGFTLYFIAMRVTCKPTYLLAAVASLWLLLSGCYRSDPEPGIPPNKAVEIYNIPLYEGVAPDALPITPATQNEAAAAGVPTLTVYVPAQDSATGTAVIVCPAGGYLFLSMQNEGYDVAAYFARQGITAAVLEYRLPNGHLQADASVAPLLDAQQALRLMRRNATAWRLRPDRVGMLGFSAGGHLSATAGTRWVSPRAENMGAESIKPDFLALLYPVISMEDSLANLISRRQLLGPQPSAATMHLFSAEQQVTNLTPPTFLVHAANDAVVSAANSKAFYRACLRRGVPAELHIYPDGNHGFGLHNPTTTDEWTQRFLIWMQMQGLLKR